MNRFDVSVIFAHYLWLGPVQTILCTYLMYLQVGVSAVVGVILLISFIPLQGKFFVYNFMWKYIIVFFSLFGENDLKVTPEDGPKDGRARTIDERNRVRNTSD